MCGTKNTYPSCIYDIQKSILKKCMEKFYCLYGDKLYDSKLYDKDVKGG